MFFKRTTDEEAYRKLLAADAADRKALARLERDLEAVRPRWTALQEKAELLCARLACNEKSYKREIHVSFWRDREAALENEIKELSAARDELTAGLVAEIVAVKARVHRRHGIVGGDFSSWASVTAQRLSANHPSEHAAKLEAARRSVASLTDLSEIFAAIEIWNTWAGELDQPVGLLNVAGVVKRASE